MEYLNFAEISKKIFFKDVLDWLNIPYTITQQGEIKGEGFIITVAKNLYFNPLGQDKGSVINFLAKKKNIDIRTAAAELKQVFLKEQKQPPKELPVLELHYCKFLEDKGISKEMAKEYEIGLVKQHSIISGKIAFKMYDENGVHTGYVAYNPQKDEWFFPKGYQRDLFNIHRIQGDSVFLTVSISEALELIKQGKQAVALLGKSMTERQEEQLKRFSYISVQHPEPDNIIVRLAKFAFVSSSAL